MQVWWNALQRILNPWPNLFFQSERQVEVRRTTASSQTWERLTGFHRLAATSGSILSFLFRLKPASVNILRVMSIASTALFFSYNLQYVLPEPNPGACHPVVQMYSRIFHSSPFLSYVQMLNWTLSQDWVMKSYTSFFPLEGVFFCTRGRSCFGRLSPPSRCPDLGWDLPDPLLFFWSHVIYL